ncbi:MAG: Gfo/Idh/MocA family protein [Minwuia sp.]|uniref:Gfo/Idh/MocA family protein n=1 Tax=Minwuia sp. TaxID=2493630 RepID=UPI003A8BEB4C
MKLGIIGCGIMGERIVRVVRDNAALGVEISGVLDPSEARRAELADAFPGLALPQDREALIGASDCIYIASPPLTHLEHARAAMAAGCAVFTEKPLAVSIEDSEAFLALVRDRGARAAVNFIFASSPSVAQLKSWMDEGAIGDVQSLELTARFSQWPRDWQMDASSWLAKRAEGGFTREVLSHFLFLTRRLLGPIEVLNARAVYPDGDGAETRIEAELMAGGIPVAVNGEVGGTDLSDHNLWQLQGSTGAIRLRDWSYAERLDEATGEWLSNPGAPSHAEMRPILLRGQVEKLKAMTEGREHALATVPEALDVQRVVERMLGS